MIRLELDSAYVSRVGGRSRNEDACGYWTSGKGCCWVVSDGAGGHAGGNLASNLVVKTVLRKFSDNPLVTEENVVQVLQSAHDVVMQAKNTDSRCGDMHATCVAVMINRESGLAVWGHAGDSRAYLFRQGKVVFQTRDHSLVQSMIDAGYGSPEMLRTHPQRSLLTSAIGNEGELLISISESNVELEEGDTFLLCSDGWWEYVEESRMQTLLAAATDMTDWLALMAECIEYPRDKEHDNYTALAVRVHFLEATASILDDQVETMSLAD